MVREKVAYVTILENEKAIAEKLSIGDILPKVYEMSDGGQLTTHAPTAKACANFNFPDDGISRGVSSIFSLKLGGDNSGGVPFDVDHLVGNYPKV